MSCDGNRGKYFSHAATSPEAQNTFGSAAEAESALEQIFNTARAQAKPGDKTLMSQAEARTRKLFDDMQVRGLKAPTHSPSGLPRRDAQFGYAAVQQTMEAMRQGKALPALARQVLEMRKRTRLVSAVGRDDHGYTRCSNCGRFAARDGGHICPATASADTLGRHLQRRLGLPASAYGNQRLDELLAGARNSGGVSLRHSLTGEPIETTLDGLPLALMTGFVPDAWQGQTQPVELNGGRIVSVLDPQGLNLVQPQSTALAAASASYGRVLPVNVLSGNALNAPPLPYHDTRAISQTDVIDGQEYDLGRFLGTEYRKGGSRGTEVESNGQKYVVGSRSQDQADWGSARHSGLEGAPKGGVAVGRTLVEAAGLLASGEVVETADGQVQVYGPGRGELLAVYDPQNETAGDTAGTPNASPAQMAAVMAYRALHPQNNYDACLAVDILRARQGKGTPLAVADGGYMALRNGTFANGGRVHLGGNVGAQRCPNCGQFMGDAHVCPAQATTMPASTPVPQMPVESAPSNLPPQVDVNVQVDTSPIAEALKNAPAPQVAVSAQVEMGDAAFDQFAQAVQAGLSGIQVSVPQSQAAVQANDLGELTKAMTGMAKAVESLAKANAKKETTPERFAEAADRLAGALSASGGMPLPVSPTPTRAGGVQRCPNCGQFMDEEHTCPPRVARQARPVTPIDQLQAQEHIFGKVVLPSPDPYLEQVPSEVGGKLYQPLEEFIPEVDPNFEINEQSERIMRGMSAALQMGAGKDKSSWTRAFGLYGPPGTGKNTIARQLAASLKTADKDGNLSQGLNYIEANITPESSMQELIGATVLEKDPETGATVSRPKLGKIGLAAAMGSVVCINEIVRNPKLATALQSMIEDGEIQIDSPEQGMVRIPVHPSTVFVMTWNPGYEGDAERPGQAPLSRIMPFRLDKPSADEQARRVESFFAGLRGEKDAVESNAQRRAEIVTRDYSLPADLTPGPEEIKASVRFFDEVSLLTGGGVGERQIGLNSDTSTAPGQRQLNRFVALGKAVGWSNAMETLKVVCDQDDQFESQWSLVRERFEAHFGVDGQAFSRQAPEQD